MLTITDLFDLIAEHTSCECSSAETTSDRLSDNCARHLAMRGHREATQQNEPASITQNLFPLERISEYLSGWDDDTPRVVIAILLWRVTADFAHDDAPLTITPGTSISETAEQYVRDHWEEAEANESAQLGPLISRFLDDVALLEDYTRVKQTRQHMAFAPDPDLILCTRRSFTILGDTWYGPTVRPEWDPCVRVELNAGLDALGQDGEPHGAVQGEWRLIWSEPDAGRTELELIVPADSWKTLIQTRFHELLAELGTNAPAESVPTTEQVVKRLLAAGWVDTTARRPDTSNPAPAATLRSNADLHRGGSPQKVSPK